MNTVTLITFYLLGVACGAMGVVLFAALSAAASMLIYSDLERAQQRIQNERHELPIETAAHMLLALVVAAILFAQTINQALAFGVLAGILVPVIVAYVLEKRRR